MFKRKSQDRIPEPSIGNEWAGREKRRLYAEHIPGIPYRKGHFIGHEYEVYGVLGRGGFGIVYLVYSHKDKSVYALKTFRDEYLEDAQARERFREEARIWIDLERHPYLVRAYYVDKHAGRLYIVMEYIAPDEQGLNSLDDYLQYQPPDLAQSLRWSIQFCLGMEYAYPKGIRSHRDIKPANIMIGQGRTIKITDFGLASVIGSASAVSGINLTVHQGKVGLSGQTMEGAGFGTPPYMPPEQFTNAAGCDERSDIYSFGVVLYQMATRGGLPFLAPLPKDNSEEEAMQFWRAMQRLHSGLPVPKIKSPLFPIIQRCLEKKPDKRYKSFKDLRTYLELLLRRQTGEVIELPKLKELNAWEWINKGYSLRILGRLDDASQCFLEATHCYDEIIKGIAERRLIISLFRKSVDYRNKMIETHIEQAAVLCGKASCFKRLDRSDEASQCLLEAVRFYEAILKIAPQNLMAWVNKGDTLSKIAEIEADRVYNNVENAEEINQADYSKVIHYYNKALSCYSKAIKLDPQYTYAWIKKGDTFETIRLHYKKDKEPNYLKKAIRCYNEALKINPQDVYTWHRKGDCLKRLHHFLRRLFVDKMCTDRKGEGYIERLLRLDILESVEDSSGERHSSKKLRRYCEEAIYCFDKALEIDPWDGYAWHRKAGCLENLFRYDEAIYCYNKILEIGPLDTNTLYLKGYIYEEQGHYEEAIRCYDKILEINPQDGEAWWEKGQVLERQGRNEETIQCYDKVLEINPRNTSTRVLKGCILKGMGRVEEAIRCYDKAIEIDPEEVSAWNEKGSLLKELGHFDEAIYCYDKASEIIPTIIQWVPEGNSFLDLGRYEEAIHCYDKALEIDPQKPYIWLAKGYCLHELSRYDEAIHCYDKAIEINPQYTEAWYNKAIAEDKLSRKQNAASSYKQFFALAPAKYSKQIKYARQRLQELEKE